MRLNALSFRDPSFREFLHKRPQEDAKLFLSSMKIFVPSLEMKGGSAGKVE